MASKITVIGAGSVGATIAYTLSQQTFASEIVIIDINKEKVDGEAMDIVQGTAFRDPVDVISGDYEDAKDSDLVIITSGVPRKAGQTRIELAQTNVNIIKDIAPRITSSWICLRLSQGYIVSRRTTSRVVTLVRVSLTVL